MRPCAREASCAVRTTVSSGARSPWKAAYLRMCALVPCGLLWQGARARSSGTRISRWQPRPCHVVTHFSPRTHILQRSYAARPGPRAGRGGTPCERSGRSTPSTRARAPRNSTARRGPVPRRPSSQGTPAARRHANGNLPNRARHLWRCHLRCQMGRVARRGGRALTADSRRAEERVAAPRRARLTYTTGASQRASSRARLRRRAPFSCGRRRLRDANCDAHRPRPPPKAPGVFLAVLRDLISASGVEWSSKWLVRGL